jgi:hypothetical protein
VSSVTDVNRNGNAFFDWISFLVVRARAAITLPLLNEADVAETKKHIDPDFDRWVRGDPLITGNSARRYGEDSSGYLTRNGLGSLEVGSDAD